MHQTSIAGTVRYSGIHDRAPGTGRQRFTSAGRGRFQHFILCFYHLRLLGRKTMKREAES